MAYKNYNWKLKTLFEKEKAVKINEEYASPMDNFRGKIPWVSSCLKKMCLFKHKHNFPIRYVRQREGGFLTVANSRKMYFSKHGIRVCLKAENEELCIFSLRKVSNKHFINPILLFQTHNIQHGFSINWGSLYLV